MKKSVKKEIKTILYLTPSVRMTGARISLLEALKRIDHAKYRPFVICPRRGELSEALEKGNIEHEIVYMRNWRKGKYIPFHLYSIARLLRTIKREKADIIHVNEFWFNPFGILAGKRAGIPVATHLRTSRTSEELPLRKLLNYKLDQSQALILISNAQKRLLKDQEALLKKSVVIYNGVDSEEFKPSEDMRAIRKSLGFNPDGLLVGLIGLQLPHKGIEDFVRAAALIGEKTPDCRFVSMGAQRDMKYLNKCKNLAQSLGIGDRFYFKEYDERIVPVFQSFDVLACPSKEEAFGRVNIEAMSCGVPVVAYAVGGIPEIVRSRETGFLCEKNDFQEMAHHILTLLQNNDLRKEFGINARQRAIEVFSMKAHVERLEKVYDSLLEAQAPTDLSLL